MKTIVFKETPEMKLIQELCKTIELARKCAAKGDNCGAIIHLEYAQECIVPDSFFEHPEMGRSNPITISR